MDYFAVAFFLLGSLLIDKNDIEAADWTGRRPFVFACAALILAIPFVSGACSANGFKAQVGSGVYIAAAPAALFLVASKARFHLVGPEAIGRLILAAIFAGLIPATIYGLMVTATPPARFYLPGQPALNIAAVYMSCMSVITLYLTADLGRAARMVGYVAVSRPADARPADRKPHVHRQHGRDPRRLCLHDAPPQDAAARDDGAHRHGPRLHGGLAVRLSRQPGAAVRSSSTGFFDGRLQTWSDGWSCSAAIRCAASARTPSSTWRSIRSTSSGPSRGSRSTPSTTRTTSS